MKYIAVDQPVSQNINAATSIPELLIRAGDRFAEWRVCVHELAYRSLRSHSRNSAADVRSATNTYIYF